MALTSFCSEMALTLLIATTCFVGIAAGSASRIYSCASTCENNHKFKYETGKIYTYDYETTMHISSAGRSRDFWNLRVSAKTEISSLDSCNLVLKLSDVRVTQTDSNNRDKIFAKADDLSNSLEKNTLMFAFQDGRVDSLCSSPDEPAWVLNFKRGLLSAFQNSMPDLEHDHLTSETDITGRCPTNYIINHYKWSSRTIRKTKDLSKCTERNVYENTGIQLFPHFPSSSSDSLPIFHTDYTCDQEISADKLLQYATCREQYGFNPFSSNPDAGVVTSAVQTLKLSSVHIGVLPSLSSNTRQSSLLFGHTKKGTVSQENFSQKARDILKQLLSSDNVQLRSPMLFKSLVTSLRHLDEEQLRSTFAAISSSYSKNVKLATKYYVDALQMTMTTSSVAIMKDLIANGHVSDASKDSWLLSLAFIPNPKKEFIVSLSSLLDNPSPSQKTLLGLSALINNYCQQSETLCDTDVDILSIIDKFVQFLPRDNRVNNKTDIERVIVSLKAIGNIEYIKSHAQDLQRFILDLRLPLEIRVAAIEAIRKSSCDELRYTLLGILSNHDDNVEARIAAYLSLMRCPTEDTIKKVKRILDTEEINQVGSFIWSHLINIQNTESPTKQNIKSILQNHILKQKFSTDALKFSRAYEKSFYSESLKTGVHGDANLIFAPESFLPRSISTNLTIDFFGRTINLLEIGGRVEGLEPWFESIFGPKGYFPESDDSKSSIIDEEKLKIIGEKFDAKGRLVESTVSAYLRIFGNELYYYRSGDEPRGFENFLQWLINEEETALTQSLTFVDTTLVMPTLTGFSLNLTLNGSAVIQLKMKGHTKINSLLNLDCDIDGYIKPSAAIQLSGSLSTDINDMKFGLRLDANAHTSSSVSGRITLKRDQLVSVRLDAPEDKIDVINFNTQLFLVNDGSEILAADTIGNRIELQGCSDGSIDRITGVEICGGLSYPNASGIDYAPNFPFTGPAAVYVFVRKTDQTLTSYNFDYRWQDLQNVMGHTTKTCALSIDTPGSSVNRKWSIEFIMNQEDNNVFAELRTPFKTLGARAKYNNNDLEKRIYASLSVDDVNQIIVDAQLRKEGNADAVTYTPYVNLQFPWIRPVSFGGFVTIQRSGKITVDVSLKDLTIRPILLAGSMTWDKNQYEIDMSLKSFLLSTRFKSQVRVRERNYLLSIGTDWSLMEAKNRHYETTVKFRDEVATLGSRKLIGSGEIVGSDLSPLSIRWEYQRRKDHVANLLEFSFDSKTFTTRQSFTTQTTENGGSICTIELTALCPTTKFDWTLFGRHARDSRATNTVFEIRQGDKKIINLNVKSHLVLDPVLDIGFEAGATWPGEDVKTTIQVKKINPNEFEGSILIQQSTQDRYVLRGKYQDYSSLGKLRRTFAIEMKNPGKPTSALTSELNSENDYSTNTVIHHNNKKYSFLAHYDPRADKGHKLTTALSWAGDDYAANASVTLKPESSRMLMDVRPSGGRRIQGGLEFSKKNNRVEAEFILKWDADGNLDKELIIRGTYDKLDNGCQIFLATSGYCGHHQIDFLTQTDGSLRSTLSHRTSLVAVTSGKRYGGSIDIQNRRIEDSIDGRVTITTYHSRNDVKIESEYQFAKDKWRVTGSYAVGDGKKYRISSNGKFRPWQQSQFSFEGNIRADIPRSEPFIFAAEHLHTENDFLSSIKIHWQGHRQEPANFTVYGSKYVSSGNYKYSGGAGVTNADKLLYSINGEHETNGAKRTTKLIFKDSYGAISLDVADESSSGPGRLGHSASFVFKSPIKTLEDVRGNTEFSIEKSAVDFKNQIFSMGKETASLAIAGSRKKEDGGGVVLEGSVNLNTASKLLQNIHLLIRHEKKRHSIRDFMELQLMPNKQSTLTVEAKFPSRNDIDLNIKVAHFHIDPIILEIKHRLSDRLDSSVYLHQGSKALGLSLSGYVKKDAANGALKLSLPTSALQHVNTYFNYIKSGKSVLIDFEIENYLKIESNGMFTNYYTFDNTVKIHPDGYKIPTVELTISQNSEPRVKHSTSLSYNSKKYSFELENINNDPTSPSFHLLITTPTAVYGPYIIDALYKSDGRSKEFNLALEYSPGKKVGLRTSLNTGDDEGKVGINITTPIKGLEKICLSSTYSLGRRKPQIDVIGVWGEHDLLQFTSTGNWASGSGEAKLFLRSPSLLDEGEIDGRLSFNFVDSFARKSLVVEVNRNNYPIAGFDVIIDKGRLLQITCRTLSPDWEYLSLKIKLEEIHEGKTVKLQFRRNDEKFEAYGILGYQYLFARVQTPFDYYYLMSIEAKSRMTDDEKFASVEIKLDSTCVETSAMYRLRSTGGEIIWTLSLPFYNHTLGVVGNYYITQGEISGSATLSHNGNVIDISGKLINDKRAKLLTFSISSPLRNFEKVEISARYFSPNPYHRVASATWKQDKVHLDLSAQLTLEDDIGIASLSFAPSNENLHAILPTFLISAKRDFSSPTKIVMLETILGTYTRARLLSTCTTENTRRGGSIKLETSHRGSDNRYIASYDYDLAGPQKKVVIKLGKNGQALDIKGTYEANTKRQPGSLVVSIEDGLSGQHYYALNVNYDIIKHMKTIDAMVHFDSYVNDFELKWSSDEKTFDFSSRFSLPQFIRQPYVAVSGSIYKNDTSRRSVLLKIDLSGELTELSGVLNQGNDAGDFDVSVLSSHQHLSNLRITGNYDLTGDEKTFRMLLQDDKSAEIRARWRQYDKIGNAELTVVATNSGGETRRVAIRTNYEFTKSKHLAEVSVDILQQQYLVRIESTLEKQKGNFILTIETPIEGYNSLGAEMHYNLNKTKVTAIAFVQWADGKRISVNVEVSIADISGRLVIETPFGDSKLVEILLVPNLNAEKKSISLSVQSDDRLDFRLTFEWVIVRLAAEVSFKVESQISELNFMDFSLSYNTRTHNHVELTISWPGAFWNKLNAIFNNVGKEMVNVEFTLQSAVDASLSRRVKLRYDVRKQYQSAGLVAVQNGNDKLELGAEYNAYDKFFIHLITPNDNYKSIEVEVTLDKERKQLNVNCTWNDNRIEILLFCDKQPLRTEISGLFTTTFPTLKLANISLSLDRSKSTGTTLNFYGQLNDDIAALIIDTEQPLKDRKHLLEASIQRGKNEKVAVTLDLNVVEKSLTAILKLTTPFKQCEFSQIKFDYGIYSSRLSTSLTVDVCSQNIFKLNGVLDIQKLKKSINVNWQCAQYSSGSLDGVYDLTKEEENARFTLQWDQSTIEARETIVKTDSIVKIRLVIGSSFSESDIIVEGEYDGNRTNKKFKIDVTYDEDEKIHVNGEISAEANVCSSGNLNIRTPFYNRGRDVFVLVNHRKTANEIRQDLLLKWGSEDFERFGVRFLAKRNGLNLAVILPSENINHLELHLKFDPNELLANMTVDNRNIFLAMFSLESDLPRSLNIHTKFQLLRYYPVELTVDYKNDNNMWSTLLLLDWQTKSYKVLAQYDKNVKVDEFHNANITVEFLNKKIIALATWQLRAGRLSLESNDSPTPWFEVTYDYKYKQKPQELNIYVKLLNESIYHLQATIDTDDNSIEISGELQSVHIHYGNTKLISFSVRGNYIRGKSINLDIEVKYDEHVHAFSIQFERNTKAFKGSAKIKSFLFSEKEISVKVDGITTPDNAEINLSISPNHNFKITLLRGDKTEARIHLDTSLVNFKSIAAGYERRPNGIRSFVSLSTTSNFYELTINTTVEAKSRNERQLTIDIGLKTFHSEHHISIEITKKSDVTNIVIEIITPLLNNKPLNIRAQLKRGRFNRLNADVSAKFGKKKLGTVSTSFNRNDKETQSKIEIVTDLFNIGNISAELQTKTEDGIELTLTVGRLHIFHSFGVTVRKSQSHREVALTVKLFEGSSTEKYFLLRMTTSSELANSLLLEWSSSHKLLLNSSTLISTFGESVRFEQTLVAPVFGIEIITINAELISTAKSKSIDLRYTNTGTWHQLYFLHQKTNFDNTLQIKANSPLIPKENFELELKLSTDTGTTEKKITGRLVFAGTTTTLTGLITDDRRGVQTAEFFVASSEFKTAKIVVKLDRSARDVVVGSFEGLCGKEKIDLQLFSSKMNKKIYGKLDVAGTTTTFTGLIEDEKQGVRTAEFVVDSTEFKSVKIVVKLDWSARDIATASLEVLYGQDNIEIQLSNSESEKKISGKLVFAGTSTTLTGLIADVKRGVRTVEFVAASSEFKTANIVVKLDGHARDFTIGSLEGSYGNDKIEMQLSNSETEKKISGRLNLGVTTTSLSIILRDDKRGIITLQIVIDSSEFSTVKIITKVDHSSTDVIIGSIQGSYGHDKFEGRFQNDDSSGINGKIAIKSSTDKTKRFRINFGYSTMLLTRSLKIYLKSGNPYIGDWGTDINWTAVKYNPRASVTVYTPYKKFEQVRVDVNFKHDERFTAVMTEICLSWPTKTYTSKVDVSFVSGYFIFVGGSLNENKYSATIGGHLTKLDYQFNSTLVWKSIEVYSANFEFKFDGLIGTIHADLQTWNSQENYELYVNLTNGLLIVLETPFKNWEKTELLYTEIKGEFIIRSITLTLANGDKYEAKLKQKLDADIFELTTPISAIQSVRIARKENVIKLKVDQYNSTTLDIRVISQPDRYSLKMTEPYKVDVLLIFKTPDEIHLIIALPQQQTIEVVMKRIILHSSSSASVNVNVDGSPLLTGEINLIDMSTDQKEEKQSITTLTYGERQIKLKMSYDRTNDGLTSSALLSLSPKRKPVGVKFMWRNLKRNDVMCDIVFYCSNEDIVVKIKKKIPRDNELIVHAEITSTVNIQNKLEFNLFVGARDRMYYNQIVITHPQAEMVIGLGLLSTPQQEALDFVFSTESKRQQKYYIHGKFNIDKLSKIADFELNFPHGTTKLKSQLNQVEGKYVIDITGHIDTEDKQVEAMIEIDKKAILIVYMLDTVNRLSVSANSHDWKSISLRVDHGLKDQLVNDLQMSLSLNSSRFLRGIFQWRPGSMLQATTAVVQGYFNTKQMIKSFLVDNLWIAINDQLRMLGQAISRFVVSIFNSYAVELEFVNEELHKVLNENEFLRNTFDFFNRYIGDYLLTFTEFIKDYLSHSMFTIRSTFTKVLYNIGEFLSHVSSSVDQCIVGLELGVKAFAQDPYGTVKSIHRQFLLIMIDIIGELQSQSDPLFRSLTVAFRQWMVIIADKFVSFLDYFKECMLALIRDAKHSPVVSRILNIVAEHLPDENALISLKNYHHKLVDKYAEAVTKGTALIHKWIQHPFVHAVSNYASQAYDKLMWICNYLQLESHIVSLCGKVYGQLKESIVEVLQEILSEYSHLWYKATHVTFDPDKGHLSFIQPLPFEWKSFRHFPALKIGEEVQHFKEWKDNLWRKYKNLPLDKFLNRVWSKYSPPPFETHAFLAGNQHYKSFDGRYFEFVGKCCYLLAKDFAGGRFTSIVQYDAEEQRSIFLYFDKTEIKISSDYSITVNGRKSLLPIYIGQISVMHIGNTVVVGKEGDVNIQCNVLYDVCIIQLPGWYRGKIGGLLGNYDNEQFNDFDTPEKRRSENIAEYANSWQVSGLQCATRNLATINHQPDNANLKICQKYLDDMMSPLNSCFKKINPAPYLQMCVNDVSDVAKRQRQQVHLSSIAVYVNECNYNGISLDLPQSVVRCNLFDQDVYSNDKKYYIRSAEISVIVEENKNCNNQFLPELMNAINTSLISLGISANKFKYIGFNGDMAHEMQQTFGFIKSLGDANLLSALEYTVNLPFRGDSARIILALPCSDSGSYVDSADFDIISERLRNEKITLHVITDKTYSDLVNTFGFNRDYAFVARDGEKVEIMDHTLQPLDSRSKLVVQSNGTIISRAYLSKQRLENRKVLFEFFANVVSSTIDKPGACQICGCLPVNGLESRAVCRPCSNAGNKLNLYGSSFYQQFGNIVHETTKLNSNMI